MCKGTAILGSRQNVYYYKNDQEHFNEISVRLG